MTAAMTGNTAKTKRRTKVRTKAEDARMTAMLKSFKRCLNAALDANDYPALHYGRQTAVADRYKVSQSAARKWVAGECMPDLEHIVLIADDLGLSVDSLLGRSSSIAVRRGRKGKQITKLKLHPTTSSIEENESENSLLGSVEFDQGLLKHTMRLQQNGVELFKVTTDSMSPSLNIGDIAFVDTCVDTIAEGGLYLFNTPSGRIMIRRVNFQLDGKIQLTCRNKSYQDIIVQKNEIQIGDAVGEFKLKLFGLIPWRITKLSGPAEQYGGIESVS